MPHGYGAVAKKRFPGSRLYAHPHSFEVEDGKTREVLVAAHRTGHGGFEDAYVDGKPVGKYGLAVLQTEGNKLEDYTLDPEGKSKYLKPKPVEKA